MTEKEQPDPAVESFLALASARLAPRTVEAYRRDLAHLAAWLGRSPTDASSDDLADGGGERLTARLRRDELEDLDLTRGEIVWASAEASARDVEAGQALG